MRKLKHCDLRALKLLSILSFNWMPESRFRRRIWPLRRLVQERRICRLSCEESPLSIWYPSLRWRMRRIKHARHHVMMAARIKQSTAAKSRCWRWQSRTPLLIKHYLECLTHSISPGQSLKANWFCSNKNQCEILNCGLQTKMTCGAPKRTSPALETSCRVRTPKLCHPTATWFQSLSERRASSKQESSWCANIQMLKKRW